MLQQAVEGTKSLDDAKLGDYIRANTFKTVVGDVKFGAKGEWEKSRVLQVQFQNVKGNDVAQFKDMSTQVVVAPAEYESGKVIFRTRRRSKRCASRRVHSEVVRPSGANRSARKDSGCDASCEARR